MEVESRVMPQHLTIVVKGAEGTNKKTLVEKLQALASTYEVNGETYELHFFVDEMPTEDEEQSVDALVYLFDATSKDTFDSMMSELEDSGGWIDNPEAYVLACDFSHCLLDDPDSPSGLSVHREVTRDDAVTEAKDLVNNYVEVGVTTGFELDFLLNRTVKSALSCRNNLPTKAMYQGSRFEKVFEAVEEEANRVYAIKENPLSFGQKGGKAAWMRIALFSAIIQDYYDPDFFKSVHHLLEWDNNARTPSMDETLRYSRHYKFDHLRYLITDKVNRYRAPKSYTNVMEKIEDLEFPVKPDRFEEFAHTIYTICHQAKERYYWTLRAGYEQVGALIFGGGKSIKILEEFLKDKGVTLSEEKLIDMHREVENQVLSAMSKRAEPDSDEKSGEEYSEEMAKLREEEGPSGISASAKKKGIKNGPP